MPQKKKAAKKATASEGVAVRTDQHDYVNRHTDGVPVRVPDAPEQTAGSDTGHSAETKKEND